MYIHSLIFGYEIGILGRRIKKKASFGHWVLTWKNISEYTPCEEKAKEGDDW